MISYYELLDMIRKGEIPYRIWFHVGNRKVSYIQNLDKIDSTFIGFMIEDFDNKDSDVGSWLGENFMESDVFNRCLSMEFDTIRKIDLSVLSTQTEKNRAFKNSINQIIDRLIILENRYESK